MRWDEFYPPRFRIMTLDERQKMTGEKHNFMPFASGEIFDAGDEGLALRLVTEPDPEEELAYVLGFLLSHEQAKKFLAELSSAVEQKWGKSGSSSEH